MQTDEFTPTLRAALLAALDTPTRTLRRGPGGFIALGETIKTSAPRTVQAFTKRAVNQLEREGLVRFDEPDFPSAVTLTAAGVAAAERLKSRTPGRTVRA